MLILPFGIMKLNLGVYDKKVSSPLAESGLVGQLWPHHMLGSSLLEEKGDRFQRLKEQTCW